MTKDCCNINLTETENGYRIDITGQDVRDKCKTVFENCCTEENIQKCFEMCCGAKK